MARWDGTAWRALGSGLNDRVLALAVAANGDVLAGGLFNDAGGNPAADRVARWNGTAWQPLGAGLLGTVVDDFVYDVVIAPNGDVLVGGDFIDAGGNPAADHVARWDGTAWQALGTGLNGSVFALAVTSSGVVNAGGSFLEVGDRSKVTQRLGIYSTSPRIFAVSITRGPAGSTLGLIGSLLTNATTVTFTSASGVATTAPVGFVVASPTSITGVTVPAGLAPGTYTVTVTTPAGISNGVTFVVGPLGTAAAAPAVAALRLYPNPARSAVAVAGAVARAAVVVLDGLGRVVTTATADAAGTASLVLPTGLAAGVYVVKCAGQTLRLVVE